MPVPNDSWAGFRSSTARTMTSIIQSLTFRVYGSIFFASSGGMSYMVCSESLRTGPQCVCDTVSISRSRGNPLRWRTSSATATDR